MANEEHLAILKQGVKVWNEWRRRNLGARPDLSVADFSQVDLHEANLVQADISFANLHAADLLEANLREADLSFVDLTWANLSFAKLSRVDLSDARLSGAALGWTDLRWADLSRADLSRADLSKADLSYANLTRATLNKADLRNTNFYRTDLNKTKFSWAEMAYTVIGDVDLSTVKGLKSVRHDGPSLIGIDTIYRSQGKIPEAFLRGAGVPDSFITYMHSLTGEAIQYHTCFISYSTKDQDFATRLHADLQAKGVRCWFAPEDIAGGKKLHEQIDQAIRLYDKLLVVLSEHSMASEWVKTEIYHARQQEVEEKRRKLFPISLVDFDTIRQWKAFDVDIGKDMAREVREYFVPDFSQWKEHDVYQNAFDRLLRDLKAEA
jgi:hypothetical protein